MFRAFLTRSACGRRREWVQEVEAIQLKLKLERCVQAVYPRRLSPLAAHPAQTLI